MPETISTAGEPQDEKRQRQRDGMSQDFRINISERSISLFLTLLEIKRFNEGSERCLFNEALQ